MANNYLSSSFILEMTAEDAEMVRLAQDASVILEFYAGDSPRDIEYKKLGPRFAALFPPKDGDDFGSFLDLFDDPDFPSFDCSIVISEVDAEGHCKVSFSGNQFGVDQVANLIFTACKSAIPCAFSWAHTCDALRPDEFGGGCVIITEAGIDFHSTTGIIGRVLGTGAGPSETPKPVFDPALVTIEQKRFSVTQWEILVCYNGQRIEQYGDKIELVGKEYRGHPREMWMAVAYREAIARDLASRLPVVEEAAITTHLTSH
ncbi:MULTISPECIES: hypothetical protein [Sphingomonadaceae]|uniref:hypothetical protein n=1 Tax=Sphingomonadaceae TaxID=41297 RepID=UPI00027C9CFE|nr:MULTISPECIES: hypothetical protein [Sphingomonadaceae]EJU09468.1 hypothetical protein LH128_28815 [Sphingomonas sp. LH128]GLK44533.1 hypothetical protein GCM10017612_24530 [Novosphingobium resinovorum]